MLKPRRSADQAAQAAIRKFRMTTAATLRGEASELIQVAGRIEDDVARMRVKAVAKYMRRLADALMQSDAP